MRPTNVPSYISNEGESYDSPSFFMNPTRPVCFIMLVTRLLSWYEIRPEKLCFCHAKAMV